LNFQTFSKRQNAYEKLVKELKGSNPKTLVVLVMRVFILLEKGMS